MNQSSKIEICARKNCNNIGEEFIQIDIIKKGGWFYSSCKKELEKSGLVLSSN
jgi:hypothetical protein